MILNAYVIYDSKAETYSDPYFFHNDGMALRAAEELRNDGRGTIFNHPEDFTFFKIGTYDKATGVFQAPETGHTSMCRFHEIPLRTAVTEASEETVYKSPDLANIKEALTNG